MQIKKDHSYRFFYLLPICLIFLSLVYSKTSHATTACDEKLTITASKPQYLDTFTAQDKLAQQLPEWSVATITSDHPIGTCLHPQRNRPVLTQD